MTTTGSPDDFDFAVGSWHVTHRRLKERLANCGEWIEFAGTSETRKVLGGRGNVEDNFLEFPDGAYRAVALRSFDPQRQEWAIWWLDGRTPGSMDAPVIGRFVDGVGRCNSRGAADTRASDRYFASDSTCFANLSRIACHP
jgi:hypothetical protein